MSLYDSRSVQLAHSPIDEGWYKPWKCGDCVERLDGDRRLHEEWLPLGSRINADGDEVWDVESSHPTNMLDARVKWPGMVLVHENTRLA